MCVHMCVAVLYCIVPSGVTKAAEAGMTVYGQC